MEARKDNRKEIDVNYARLTTSEASKKRGDITNNAK